MTPFARIHYRQGDKTKMTSVVGEAYRDEACDRLMPPGTGEHTIRINATLERDPANQADQKAVKVMIGSSHVGFLDRKTAAKYARCLDQAERNRVIVSCDAKMVRKPSAYRRKRTIQVSVWLPPPSRIAREAIA